MTLENQSMVPEKPIGLVVTYTEKEVNEAYWAVVREVRLPQLMLAALSFSFMLPVLCLVFYSVAHRNPVGSEPDLLQTLLTVIAFLSPFGMPIAACTLIYVLQKKLNLLSYKSRPSLHSGMSYLLGSNGVALEYSAGKGLIEWKDFQFAVETAESFSVGESPDDIFIFPKRCFQSKHQLKVMRSWLTANISKYSFVGKVKADAQVVFDAPQVKSTEQTSSNSTEQTSSNSIGQFSSNSTKLSSGKLFEQSLIKALDKDSSSLPDQFSGESADESIDDCIDDCTDATSIDVSKQSLDTSSALFQDKSLEQSPQKISDDVEIDGDHLHMKESKKPGLRVEVTYSAAEIKSAEILYFFRKRLAALGSVYLVQALLPPFLLQVVGQIADAKSVASEFYGYYSSYVWLLLPIVLIHATYLYFKVTSSATIARLTAQPIVFEFYEDTYEMYIGDKYSSTPWQSIYEIWETKNEYLFLLGRGGTALTILPKRCLDRMASASLRDLLPRKVPRYWNLE